MIVAKPKKASQNYTEKQRRLVQKLHKSGKLISAFCEATSGFAKLMSPKGKLWIVAPLLGALQLWNFPRLLEPSKCRIISITLYVIEGLQPVVQQSTIWPSGSRALRSQTWLRKTTQKVALIYPVIEPIDTIFCAVLRSHACFRKLFEFEG